MKKTVAIRARITTAFKIIISIKQLIKNEDNLKHEWWSELLQGLTLEEAKQNLYREWERELPWEEGARAEVIDYI